MCSMRIAQVAPLYESVPPHLYGGTERVVSYLTEELVEQGHDVTLFASADSVTRAELIPMCPRALRLDSECQDPLAHHIAMLEQVFRRARDFDIVHFHVDYLHFPFSARAEIRSLTTLHGRLNIPDLIPLYRLFPCAPLVSISDSQRQPLQGVNWVGTVHHGLPDDLLRLEESPADYVAFLGRVSPEKGLDRAIEIAIRSGVRLRIAAKVDRVDRDYYETTIRPLLDHPLIEFIGEIGEHQKQDFLGHAQALLFPIDWDEPFGLAMIEAMACGTPVVAFRRGSVSEVIDQGITGVIADGLDAAVAAVDTVRKMSRRRCREQFERRFTSARMAREYVEIYNLLAPTTERSDVHTAVPN